MLHKLLLSRNNLKARKLLNSLGAVIESANAVDGQEAKSWSLLSTLAYKLHIAEKERTQFEGGRKHLGPRTGGHPYD
jgi:hypothetical protein